MNFSTMLLCLMFMCLSACGFALRGTEATATLTDTFLLEPYNPYDPLHSVVRDQLELAHATITTRRDNSTAILELKKENVARQVTVIGTDGEIKQQLLTYTFDYQLKNKTGKVLIPTRTIRATRILYIQPGQILSQDNEEKELTKIMRFEAVQQLLRQLSAFNRQSHTILPATP